jgi:hypothetical protein
MLDTPVPPMLDRPTDMELRSLTVGDDERPRHGMSVQLVGPAMS